MMCDNKEDDEHLSPSIDIFDSRYFFINKTLNIRMGLWPYHPSRHFVRLCWIFTFIIFTVPHIVGLKVNYSDIDRLLYHVAFIAFMTAAIFKYITMIFAEDELKLMYEGIVNNWSMIVDSAEKQILHNYSEKGRKFTFFYIGILLTLFSFYVMLPLTPMILNTIYPLAEPRPLQYILYGEFLLEDPDTHYAKIYLWDILSAASILTVLIVIDPMYTICVDHCLGLYAILKYRLRKPNQLRYQDSSQDEDQSYDYVVKIIKTHTNLLEFTQTLEASYSSCFLVIMCIHIIAVPIISVIMITNLDNNTTIFIRYLLLFISLKVHLFFICYPGQKLIDYSKGLFSDAYCNDWYASSDRTKNLLSIFMLRCTEPCTITAGGLMDMNMENFVSITQTSVSYVTVLAAFRES